MKTGISTLVAGARVFPVCMFGWKMVLMAWSRTTCWEHLSIDRRQRSPSPLRSFF